jgi:MFS family permease
MQIPVLLASGYFVDAWRTRHAGEPGALYLGYALPNLLGAFCLMASLAPLARMPATPNTPARDRKRTAWRSIAAPFRDRRFARVLLFRIWLGLSSGITQAVQTTFPKRVLGLGIGDLAFMTTTMRVGQIGASRWIGPFSDRYGNRPLLVLGQICVAASLVFFVVASPSSFLNAWLILGTYVLWSAYAAHNICLPNLVLKLAPYQDKAGYVAANDALGSLAHAAATVFGGWWFDRLTHRFSAEEQGYAYIILFGTGIVMRTLGIPLAARLIEPGAWPWKSILRRRAV